MPVIPNRLEERRLYWNLSQDDVAKALKIRHYQQYAQWETGEHQPSGPNIEKLAKVLRCSSDYLLGLVDNPDNIFQDEKLDDDERKMIYLKRQGLLNEAAVFVLSGRLPAELDNATRPQIHSGNESGISGSDPAA